MAYWRNHHGVVVVGGAQLGSGQMVGDKKNTIFGDLLSLKNPPHPNIYSYTQQAVGNRSPELRTQSGAADKAMRIAGLTMVVKTMQVNGGPDRV